MTHAGHTCIIQTRENITHADRLSILGVRRVDVDVYDINFSLFIQNKCLPDLLRSFSRNKALSLPRSIASNLSRSPLMVRTFIQKLENHLNLIFLKWPLVFIKFNFVSGHSNRLICLRCV